jgi:hypothetical protein
MSTIFIGGFSSRPAAAPAGSLPAPSLHISRLDRSTSHVGRNRCAMREAWLQHDDFR